MPMILSLKHFNVQDRKEKLTFQKTQFHSLLLMGEFHFVMSLAI